METTMGVKFANMQQPDSKNLSQNFANSHTLDRRALLAAAGSSIAAGLGVACPDPAHAATESPYGKSRIDAYSHVSSLKYLDALEKQQGKPAAISTALRRKPSLTDLKARISLLDRNEVDINVLVPVPWLEAFPRVATDRTLAPQMAGLMNDELAAFVGSEPSRFRGVAVLPSVDPDAMVAELHRAVKELGFLGAFVPVGPTAKRMDHPDFEHLYRSIVELDATLWLHPSRPPLPDYADESRSQYGEWIAIGWPYDTTTAMYRIVYSGVFDRYPTIRIVTHHHGGMVPYYAERIQSSGADDDAGVPDIKSAKPNIEHFKKFYCDTACNEFAPKVLELALDFFGPERVLFGSDAPFGANDGQRFTTEVLRSIEAMQVSSDVRKDILSRSASRTLKIV
jgi:predicted TIM-barrel fold metal-dependent hydrolase